MRKILGAFAFVLLTQLAFADGSQQLYKNISQSVLYLAHEVYFDSAKVKNFNLWKEAERINKTKYLDTWIPMMSGSGFYIDNAGTILTNRHVARAGNQKLMRKQALQFYTDMLEKTLIVTFSEKDLKQMIAELDKIISLGDYQFSVYANDQLIGQAKVLLLATIREPDLALVKVDRAAANHIILEDPKSMGTGLVGTEVYSFGYPLGFTLDSFFKQRVVTMNSGIVSAFRKAEYSIQHSAAISHGNSGGPLVNKAGKVVGVNTAIIEENANSLFYAIGCDQIQDFLTRNNYKDLLIENAKASQQP